MGICFKLYFALNVLSLLKNGEDGIRTHDADYST